MLAFDLDEMHAELTKSFVHELNVVTTVESLRDGPSFL